MVTSSLFRSMLNCFKPSSSAMYLEEALETDCGCCCMTFFLSRSVAKRRRNWMLDEPRHQNGGIRKYLSFFLQVEGVDLLQLSFLGGVSKAYRVCAMESLTTRKKKVALLACRDVCGSRTSDP